MARAGGTPLTGASAVSYAEAEAEWKGGRHLCSAPEVGILFRVEAVSYSYVIDADREEYGITAPRLEVFGGEVLRWTPCGATLRYHRSGARQKWVDLRDGAKQYASRTVEEAVRQFAERRRRQIWLLKRQLARAEFEHTLATSLLARPNGDDTCTPPTI